MIDPTKHKTSSISDVLVCAVCKKTFASEVVLKNHAKYVHSEERKWPCDDCDAKFKQQKDLRIHNLNQMKEDYQEAEKKKVDIFKCNECFATFSYKKNLNAHMRSKHADNAELFECDKCISKFSNKRTLVNHQKVKHGPEVEQHVCTACGKTFPDLKSMKKHERKHKAN